MVVQFMRVALLEQTKPVGGAQAIRVSVVVGAHLEIVCAVERQDIEQAGIPFAQDIVIVLGQFLHVAIDPHLQG